MRRAFSVMDADFSDITTDLLLYVDAVFHKAFVALDEQGTEAAAATAVIIKTISLPPPAEFFLDRPLASMGCSTRVATRFINLAAQRNSTTVTATMTRGKTSRCIKSK